MRKIDQMCQILSDFIRDKDFFYRKDFTNTYKLDENMKEICCLITAALAKFVKQKRLLVSDRKGNSLQYMVLQGKNPENKLER